MRKSAEMPAGVHRLAGLGLALCALLLVAAVLIARSLGVGAARSARLPTSPAASIRAYYERVNAQDYASNWPLLTDHLRKRINCCHANYDDLSQYVLLWDNIERVDVGSIRVGEEAAGRATVLVDLTYQTKSGQHLTQSDTEFRLLWDAANQRWLFDDQDPVTPGG